MTWASGVSFSGLQAASAAALNRDTPTNASANSAEAQPLPGNLRIDRVTHAVLALGHRSHALLADAGIDRSERSRLSLVPVARFPHGVAWRCVAFIGRAAIGARRMLGDLEREFLRPDCEFKGVAAFVSIERDFELIEDFEKVAGSGRR